MGKTKSNPLDASSYVEPIGIIVDNLPQDIIVAKFSEKAKKQAELARKAINERIENIKIKIENIRNPSKRDLFNKKLENYKKQLEYELEMLLDEEQCSQYISSYMDVFSKVFAEYSIELKSIYNFYNVPIVGDNIDRNTMFGILISLYDKLDGEKKECLTIDIRNIKDTSLSLYRTNLKQVVEEYLMKKEAEQMINDKGLLESVSLEDITLECVEKNKSKIEEATSSEVGLIIDALESKYTNKQDFLVNEISDLLGVSKSKNESSGISEYSSSEAERIITNLKSIRNAKLHAERLEIIEGLTKHIEKFGIIEFLSANIDPNVKVYADGYAFKRKEGAGKSQEDIEINKAFFYKLSKYLEINVKPDEFETLEEIFNTFFLLDFKFFDGYSKELTEIKHNNNITNKFTAAILTNKNSETLLLSLFYKLKEKGEVKVCKDCKIGNSLECIDKTACSDFVEDLKNSYMDNKYYIIQSILKLNEGTIGEVINVLLSIVSKSDMILSEFDAWKNTSPEAIGMDDNKALKLFLKKQLKKS